MENTFTYVARSAVEPAHVVTFTLHGNLLSIDPGLAHSLFIPAALAPVAVGGSTDGGNSEELSTADSWLTAVTRALDEHGGEPFKVTEVDASTAGDSLRVTAWDENSVQRLAPVIVAMKRVDNPEGAKAFVEELKRRQAAAEFPGKVMQTVGPRSSWFLVGFLAALLFVTWLRR